MCGLIKKYKKYIIDKIEQQKIEYYIKQEKYEKDYVSRNISDDINFSWKNVKLIFRKAKFVLRGPAGFYAITFPEFDILWEFIRKHQMETEKLFIQGLLDDNPYVVAYCILGLSILKSPILEQLPKEVLDRKDVIEYRIAFLIGDCTLKEFAELKPGAGMIVPK